MVSIEEKIFREIETRKQQRAKIAEFKRTIDPSTFSQTITRLCRDCKQIKECGWNYSFNLNGQPLYYNRCKDCHNKYSANNQKLHRDTQLENIKQHKRNRKQRCIDYLGGKCKICSYSKPIALTFHHIYPDEKEYEIG